MNRLQRWFRQLMELVRLDIRADSMTLADAQAQLLREDVARLSVAAEEWRNECLASIHEANSQISFATAASSTTPRLTDDTLRVWDAVSYAAEKWDKDPQAIGRTTEILCWARIYLGENHWAVPPEDVLLWFLVQRDRINGGRRVGKFS